MTQGMKKTSITLQRIIKRNRVKADRKLYNTLFIRQTVATLVRLRTEHCDLNHYLHRFNIKDTSYCECGQGKETMELYLLECHKYNEKLRKDVGTG